MSEAVYHLEIMVDGYVYSRDFSPPLEDDIEIERAIDKMVWDAKHGGLLPDDGDDGG
jgi:hypothetical protein